MSFDLDKLKIPERKKEFKSFNWFWIPSAAVLIIILLVGWFFFLRKKAVKHVSFYTVSSHSGSNSPVLTVGGYLEPAEKVSLSSVIQNKIMELPVKTGEYVRKGTIVALMNNRTLFWQEQNLLKQAQASLAKVKEINLEIQTQKVKQLENEEEGGLKVKEAVSSLKQQEVNLYHKKRNLERDKKLYAQKALSLIDMEKAQKGYALAVLKVQSEQEQLKSDKASLKNIFIQRLLLIKKKEEKKAALLQYQAYEAQLAEVNQELKDTKIRAPFNGMVLKKNAEPGEVVSPGKTILVLGRTKKYYVKADVDEGELRELTKAKQFTIEFNILPGKVFKGKLKLISPRVNRQKGTVRVEVWLLGNNPLLKPGITAKINLYRNLNKILNRTLSIPSAAVFEKNHNHFVYLYQNGEALAKKVTLSRIGSHYADVVSGLSSGDVIVKDAEGIHNHERINRDD